LHTVLHVAEAAIFDFRSTQYKKVYQRNIPLNDLVVTD